MRFLRPEAFAAACDSSGAPPPGIGRFIDLEQPGASDKMKGCNKGVLVEALIDWAMSKPPESEVQPIDRYRLLEQWSSDDVTAATRVTEEAPLPRSPSSPIDQEGQEDKNGDEGMDDELGDNDTAVSPTAADDLEQKCAYATLCPPPNPL